MKITVPPRCLKSNFSTNGFSLVEIVLCLGIIAFAFVGIVGLLPLGLGNFRGAIDTSTSAQIFQKVMNDVKQADFDELVPAGTNQFYTLNSRYYDDQGVEKSSPSGAIYHVRVRGSRPSTAFTSLPGVTTRFNLANSTFLTIQIAANPGNKTLDVDSANELWKTVDASGRSIPISTFTGVVTRH